MGEESRQLKQHINDTRDELGHNIDTLQNKVKRTFNWRAQFEERPMTMIGIAFGAGALLSTVVGSAGSRSRRQGGDGSLSGASRTTSGPNAQKAPETWDKIKGALVGVVAARTQTFLEEVIPGFRREYEKVEGERSEKDSPQLSKSATA